MKLYYLTLWPYLLIGQIYCCEQNPTLGIIKVSFDPSEIPESEMHKAARCNDWKKIIFLYNQGNKVDSYDNKAQTPLHIAAIYGYIETAMILLQRRANPNARCKLGKTPLHLAAEHGHEDMVELLLQFGAHPNEKNSIEDMPAQLANRHAHFDIMIKLIEASAKAKIFEIERLNAIYHNLHGK